MRPAVAGSVTVTLYVALPRFRRPDPAGRRAAFAHGNDKQRKTTTLDPVRRGVGNGSVLSVCQAGADAQESPGLEIPFDSVAAGP
jgi:hypothetical protein